MAKFKDFDEAFAEDDDGQAPPIPIKLFGEVWELPGDPPAEAMLLRKRGQAALRRLALAQATGKEITEDMIVDFDDSLSTFDLMKHARQMVGEETLAEWFRRGLGYDKLKRILSWVAEQHDGVPESDDAEEEQARDADAPEGDREGKPEAPSKGASRGSRSSNGGQQSKRASKQPTGST